MNGDPRLPTPLRLELLCAPGCRHCASVDQMVRRVLDDLETDRVQYRVVDVVDEIDHAVEMGVRATPSIAINGRVVFVSAPSERRFRTHLSNLVGRLN